MEDMHQTEQALRDRRVIAILRGNFRQEQVDQIADILLAHGFGAIEYTWNSPAAPEVIAHLSGRSDKALLVGAGTLTTVSDVRTAVRAGADFLITPHWDGELSACAQKHGCLLIPGVFTPTEVQAARSCGRHLLKLFPASLGGPSHLRALKGPFEDVDFVPTGGVDVSNAAAYLEAGAAAVAIGSAIFRPDLTASEIEARVVGLRAALDGTREA